MGSISCHITPLVLINSFGGDTRTHARTHTHTLIQTSSQKQSAPACGWSTPGLKSFGISKISKILNLACLKISMWWTDPLHKSVHMRVLFIQLLFYTFHQQLHIIHVGRYVGMSMFKSIIKVLYWNFFDTRLKMFDILHCSPTLPVVPYTVQTPYRVKQGILSL